MAKEVLVGTSSLVEGLQTVVREYAADGRFFALVMLIPAEPTSLSTKYSLIVSAVWLDDKSPREAVSGILKNLIAQLGSTESPEYQKLARVTVVNSGDPFVTAITSAFKVTNSDFTIENCNINGVQIDRAVLLESHRPDRSSQQTSLSIEEQRSRKPGRNEPCPCGSGAKFKNCHGK
jgi:hypothetical protein